MSMNFSELCGSGVSATNKSFKSTNSFRKPTIYALFYYLRWTVKKMFLLVIINLGSWSVTIDIRSILEK